VENKGADCKHNKGVLATSSRKCCGGKIINRTRINCDKISIAHAEVGCRAEICELFEAK